MTGSPAHPDLVVLLANYAPDRQESMLRYASALGRDLNGIGLRTRTVHPPVIVGRLGRLVPRLAKWGGYVDKYVLFHFVLIGLRLRFARRCVLFHVCDHSNAPWIRLLPRARTIVTCHDVIAIKAARGEDDTVTASRAGRLLQRHILRWLLAATWVACDSDATRTDLEALAGKEPRWSQLGARRFVVHIGFNADFSPLDEESRIRHLSELGIRADERFLLHVGSALARKNRRLLVELLAPPISWAEKVCFAGAPLDHELTGLIRRHDLDLRVIEAARPTHAQLVALYQSCSVFVFPSLSEGFGWPVIEAQAAGALVVASSAPPMPEIGGGGALYFDPRDLEGLVARLREVDDERRAEELLRQARLNAARFEPSRAATRYLEAYEEMLSA